MQQQDQVNRRILESMADGVLVIDMRGTITQFNPAAATMLGIAQDTAVGSSLAALFIELPGYGAFVDSVLDAIYADSPQPARLVSIELEDGRRVWLKLTTSYLDAADAQGRAVLAVFSDVTQLEEAYEKERRLAEELQGAHRQLQDAYIQIESRNAELKSAFRRSQSVRLWATAAAIAVFALAGYWVMRGLGGSRELPAAVVAAPAAAAGAQAYHEVEPRPVQASITYSGRVMPGQVLTMIAPFDTTVASRHVEYGERVKTGQRLLELDPTDIEIRFRRARSELAQAEEKLEKLENWERGKEMQAARRAVRQAEAELARARKELEDNVYLHQRGIVPERELASARRAAEDARVRLEVAREDVTETARQAGPVQLESARAELANARSEYESTKQKLEQATVVAPVDGIVLSPLEKQAEKPVSIEPGSRISAGAPLLVIGDMNSLEVEGNIDELDIHKVRAGQTAQVRIGALDGPGFAGKITHVSSQARESDNRGLPGFRLVARVEDLTAADLQQVRIGMSAVVTVLTRQDAGALVVPHAYVGGGADGRWVLRERAGAAPERVPVQVGGSLFDGVEITAGIAVGDRLLPAVELR